jgi:hypothetical protein
MWGAINYEQLGNNAINVITLLVIAFTAILSALNRLGISVAARGLATIKGNIESIKGDTEAIADAATTAATKADTAATKADMAAAHGAQMNQRLTRWMTNEFQTAYRQGYEDAVRGNPNVPPVFPVVIGMAAPWPGWPNHPGVFLDPTQLAGTPEPAETPPPPDPRGPEPVSRPPVSAEKPPMTAPTDLPPVVPPRVVESPVLPHPEQDLKS